MPKFKVEYFHTGASRTDAPSRTKVIQADSREDAEELAVVHMQRGEGDYQVKPA